MGRTNEKQSRKCNGFCLSDPFPLQWGKAPIPITYNFELVADLLHDCCEQLQRSSNALRRIAEGEVLTYLEQHIAALPSAIVAMCLAIKPLRPLRAPSASNVVLQRPVVACNRAIIHACKWSGHRVRCFTARTDPNGRNWRKNAAVRGRASATQVTGCLCWEKRYDWWGLLTTHMQQRATKSLPTDPTPSNFRKRLLVRKYQMAWTHAVYQRVVSA
eukprot:9470063-Pyramimonas_sp.AAC.1